jgi:hypothetical protein
MLDHHGQLFGIQTILPPFSSLSFHLIIMSDHHDQDFGIPPFNSLSVHLIIMSDHHDQDFGIPPFSWSSHGTVQGPGVKGVVIQS